MEEEAKQGQLAIECEQRPSFARNGHNVKTLGYVERLQQQLFFHCDKETKVKIFLFFFLVLFIFFYFFQETLQVLGLQRVHNKFIAKRLTIF